MKKLLVLGIIIIFTPVYATEPAQEEQQSLEKYQTKSIDEENIIHLIHQFEKGYSTANENTILDLYTPDAMIQTSTGKGDYRGVLITKGEHAKRLSKQLERMRASSTKLEIFSPESFEIRGNKGYWSGPYKLSARSSRINLKEEGIINFEFKNTDTGWLISKRTWEIIDCNYPGFKEWKQKQK